MSLNLANIKIICPDCRGEALRIVCTTCQGQGLVAYTTAVDELGLDETEYDSIEAFRLSFSIEETEL